MGLKVIPVRDLFVTLVRIMEIEGFTFFLFKDSTGISYEFRGYSNWNWFVGKQFTIEKGLAVTNLDNRSDYYFNSDVVIREGDRRLRYSPKLPDVVEL